MQFSKQTILALTPFLLAAPVTAAPVEDVEREDTLVKRVAWLPILEGIGIAAGLVETITNMAGEGDGGGNEKSEPKPLKDIAPEPGRPKRPTEVVCITDQKPANPVWFRTKMREKCSMIVNEKPISSEDKYNGMISHTWSETADWGQELTFEMAWKSSPPQEEGDGYTEPLSEHMCKEMVDAVGDRCQPSTYEGEGQTQGGHVLWNQEMLFTVDVTD